MRFRRELLRVLQNIAESDAVLVASFTMMGEPSREDSLFISVTIDTSDEVFQLS